MGPIKITKGHSPLKVARGRCRIKRVLKRGLLSPKLFCIYINDQPLMQLATKKKHTLVCRRHRPFVFDTNSEMTMGRIIKRS